MFSDEIRKYLVFEEPTEKSFAFFEFTNRVRFGGQCLGIYIKAVDSWLIVDAGMVASDEIDEEDLPEEERRGLNQPQLEVLQQIWPKVIGVFGLHAHDDHITEMPKLYYEMQGIGHQVPLYTSPFTACRIRQKFRNYVKDTGKKVIMPEIKEVLRGNKVEIAGDKGLRIIAFAVPHSTPEAYCLDFDIPTADEKKFHKFALLTDSTLRDCAYSQGLTWNYQSHLTSRAPYDAVAYDSLYVGRPGFTKSEDVVRETFRYCIQNSPGNLLVTHFATNVWRSRMVQEEADRAGLWHWFCGRTMLEIAEIGQKLGWLHNKEKNPDFCSRAIISATGNQAEARAALARASFGDNQDLILGPTDSIAHMAEIIPGNEERTVKMLYRCALICSQGKIFISKNTHKLMKATFGENLPANIEVVKGLHCSGHMSEDDHKMILSLTRAKYYIPIHFPRTDAKVAAIQSFADNFSTTCEPIFIL